MSESESEYFTGVISIDIYIHQANDCEDQSLYLTSDMNLATGSSELSAEDIIDAGSVFHSLFVSVLVNVST